MAKSGYLAVLLVLCLVSAAFGKEESVLKDNEYGGITKVIVFSEKDAEYKKGIKQIVTAYDAKKTKIMVEVQATQVQSEREGWDKTVTYFWGGTSVGEVYSTDSHSEVFGFDRMVNYYDNNKLLYKREYYLRKDSAFANLGVYKRVVYFDENGRKTGSEDLDSLGNVVEITLEDYQRLQKGKGGGN